MIRKNKLIAYLIGASAFSMIASGPVSAAADLFIRDTIADTGVEPYAGPGPIYVSPDIWVRKNPDPNYEPYPFNPSLPLPWTPLADENPEYRDPKTSRPNYVYVRIHNRGNQPSTGTERLRVYQAKASTGLAWPGNWVDYVAAMCSQALLQGIEITKPRINAKTATVAQRQAYRDALLAIQANPLFAYSDGVQYWRKQNAVHAPGNPEHGNPAFFAWHREMVNQFEHLMQKADPLVTLLYWDWQQDPRSGVNLFDADFMGTANGTVAAPLTPLQPPTLVRNVGQVIAQCPGFDSDVSVLANGSFTSLASDVESTPNHNCAHGYIGGFSGTVGQISSTATSAQDPFFFQLHGNVDRLWANWQRNGANPARIDPVSAYGAASSNVQINSTMRPWDGSNGVAPWATSAIGKDSKDPSIVFPPIYDTAPLTIPVLQPGESVVIEIPWFPPNVNNFNCASQSGHFCLLARIETSAAAPFGMTTPEVISVPANTVANNNIAWKNVSIVDAETEPLFKLSSGTMIRNIFDTDMTFAIDLIDRTPRGPIPLARLGQVDLILPTEILERIGRGRQLRDVKLVRDDRRNTVLRITGRNPRFVVPMKPKETFTAQFAVTLREAGQARRLAVTPYHFDIEQTIAGGRLRPDDPQRLIGGVRMTVDLTAVGPGRKPAKLADGAIVLTPLERKMLPLRRVATDRARESLRDVVEIRHFAPGEPIGVEVRLPGELAQARNLVLDVDGKVEALAPSADARRVIRFDKPGVHFITVRPADDRAGVGGLRTRVLISENIPPNAIITSPDEGRHFAVGQDIVVTVETAAAFGRRVKSVSLYVKDDDLFVTGLDLVNSGNRPVATGAGPGTQRFVFRPTKPGMYMFQVGAVDDRNVTGVSGHVMVMVGH